MSDGFLPSDRAATPLGQVDTPPELARELARRLAPHLPAAPELLDPACGDGALLAAAVSELAPTALHGIELDPVRAARARRRLAGVRPLSVAVGDALDRARPWPARAAVLANPPWASFSGRQAARTRGPRSARGWPSLHGDFLIRISEHVAASGLPAAVLAPASVLELERYAPLRRAIEVHARLLEPPGELAEDAFPGVVGPAALLLLGPAGTAGAAWSPAPEPAEPLLALLERCPRLPTGTFADPGVHTGNAAAELLAAEPGPGRAPLRRGRDLQPYALGPASQWLRTDLAPTAAHRFRAGPLERYAAFPVLLRQTADRPVAALHRPPERFRNSLLAARAVPELDPAFLVAVLNGPVAAFWHRARHRDARQRSFPQVKVGHLAGQPLPLRARADAPELHDEVAARVRALDPRRGDFGAERRAIEALVLRAFDLPSAARAAIAASLGRSQLRP